MCLKPDTDTVEFSERDFRSLPRNLHPCLDRWEERRHLRADLAQISSKGKIVVTSDLSNQLDLNGFFLINLLTDIFGSHDTNSMHVFCFQWMIPKSLMTSWKLFKP